MADFSYLSDTDDSAVEELIQQTQDLCVLEQVSKINCSSFTNSDLPADLESRFSKLKSFPARNTSDGFKNLGSKHASFKGFGECPDRKDLDLKDGVRSFEGKSKSRSGSFCGFDEDDLDLEEVKKGKSKSGFESFSGSDEGLDEQNVNLMTSSDEKKMSKMGNSARKKSFKEKPKSGFYGFYDFDEGLDEKNVNLKTNSAGTRSYKGLSKMENSQGKKSFKAKAKSGSERFSGVIDAKGLEFLPVSSMENDVLSASKRRSVNKGGSSRGSSGSVSASPPKRNGCFWWTPKNKKNSAKNVDFLKEQEKILKKAMKEQERINKEMEKFAKLAKQASARIIRSGVEDVLSDSDGR